MILSNVTRSGERSSHSQLHIKRCPLHTVYCTLHTAHCTVQRTSHTAHWTLDVPKFPCRVVFSRFLPEDEQRTKLVSAHPQIHLSLEKCVIEWNSTFCKYFCTMVKCYSKPCCRHKDRLTTVITVCN